MWSEKAQVRKVEKQFLQVEQLTDKISFIHWLVVLKMVWISHPGQLSLAIPSWVGTVSTS